MVYPNQFTENDGGVTSSKLRWSKPISFRTGSETPSEPPINIQQVGSSTGGAASHNDILRPTMLTKSRNSLAL